jgi:hypothetical protein
MDNNGQPETPQQTIQRLAGMGINQNTCNELHTALNNLQPLQGPLEAPALGEAMDIDDVVAGANQPGGGRRRKGSMKASKTRKVNPALKSWVAFVKKVQHEEKISYPDAMKRASKRKSEWKRGGALSQTMAPAATYGGSLASTAAPAATYGGSLSSTAAPVSSSASHIPLEGGRRRSKKRRGSKKRRTNRKY